jgi:hypothetical protein
MTYPYKSSRKDGFELFEQTIRLRLNGTNFGPLDRDILTSSAI